jgi:hypothetical protein
MDTSGYVVNGAGAGPSGYRLDGYFALLRGRRREVLRTLVITLVLSAVQWPMRQSALGNWDNAYPFSVSVPGRLSLMVDVAMIFAYLLLAYRSFGLLRALRPATWVLTANQVGVGLVLTGGMLDLWEDVRLWQLLPKREFGSQSLTLSWDDAVGVSLGSTTFSGVMVGTVLVGLALVLVTTVVGHKGASSRYVQPLDVSSHDMGGDIICCSGGGIRSAAFSLGGLEALSDAGIYSTARAVLGVSGGGYTAAAYHVARWNPTDDGEQSEEWPGRLPPGGAPPPYGLASPETGWVRRHTRYVLGSATVALQAVLSLGFGIAVNLLMLGALIGGLAWILAWLMLASGRLPGGGSFGAEWATVAHVWVLPAAGALVFVFRKVVERWWTSPSWLRSLSERAIGVLIVGGGAATALVLGVPWILQSLDSFANGNSSVWADLVRALGLSTSHSEVAPGSAVKTSGATVTTIVGAILAVLASLKSAGQESGPGSSGIGKLWAKIWAKVKDPVVPWLAAIVVALVVLVVLLRWVAALVANPALLERWGLAYAFGAVLIAAKIGTDANRTSLHHFFRERISGAFLVRRAGDSVEPLPYRRPVRFSRSGPLDGGPELIACAVANASDEEIVASKRGCVPFIFDRRSIGLTDRLLPPGEAQRNSAVYEFAADTFYRDATLPAALAMSGAAFSPLAGRENVRLGPYRAVLALANARLGVWLPNPLWIDEKGLFKRLRRLGRHEEAADVLCRLTEAAGARANLRLRLQEEEWDKYEELERLGRVVRADRQTLHDVLRRIAAINQQIAAATRQGGLLDPRQLHAQLQSDLDAATQRLNSSERAANDFLVVSFSAPPQTNASALFWSSVEGVRIIFKKPGLTRLAKEAVGKASIYDRFLYVTDGGHYDNLGLIEALRRRPARIYLLDASNDKEDTFRTLGRAIATARMDLDCDVKLDPRGMRRSAASPATAAWSIGSYKYASGEEGQILLCKAIMLGDLTWDIQTYADDNTDFPRTSTNNQLYSEFDFEAYRALGHAATTELIMSSVPPSEDEERPGPTIEVLVFE